jgi:hypothetical protein
VIAKLARSNDRERKGADWFVQTRMKIGEEPTLANGAKGRPPKRFLELKGAPPARRTLGLLFQFTFKL